MLRNFTIVTFLVVHVATGIRATHIQPTSTQNHQPTDLKLILRERRQSNASNTTTTTANQCGILQCCRQLSSCMPATCGLDAQTCAVLEFNTLVSQLGQYRPGGVFPGAALVPPPDADTSGAVLYHLPGALRAEVLSTPRITSNLPLSAVTGGGPRQRYAPFSSAYGTVVFDQTSTIVISDIPVNRRIQTYVLQQAQPTLAQLTFINYGALTDIANRLSCGPFTVAALSRTVSGSGTTIVRTVPQVIRPLGNTVLPATCGGIVLASQQLAAPSPTPTPAAFIVPTTIAPSTTSDASSLAAGPSVYPLTSLSSSSTISSSASLLTTTITVTVTPTTNTSSSVSGPAQKSTTIPPGKVAIRYTVLTAPPP